MIRLDYEIIADVIEPGSKVLDLGCGDGELLALLKEKKQCHGTGVEIDVRETVRAMERGVSVAQGDISRDLDVYGSKRFDYVILNESLQQVLNIEQVVDAALRIGKHVIVGVPNFCQFTARFQLFFMGRVPMTGALPFKWYNTPNLRFLSIKDFRCFCRDKGIAIERARYLMHGREVVFLPNLFADVAILVLTK